LKLFPLKVTPLKNIKKLFEIPKTPTYQADQIGPFLPVWLLLEVVIFIKRCSSQKILIFSAIFGLN